jgi:hypothetical protein
MAPTTRPSRYQLGIGTLFGVRGAHLNGTRRLGVHLSDNVTSMPVTFSEVAGTISS